MIGCTLWFTSPCDIGGNRDLMIDSMHTENSANLHGRFAFWRHHPLDTVRPKSNFRIAFALQNLPMHLAISHAAAAIAALRIYHDLSRYLSADRTDFPPALFQLKSSTTVLSP